MGQSIFSNGSIETLKKSQASATLILLNLAKFNKSNVAHRPDFFFKVSMDPLLKIDCPISTFSGLGGHGLSFFSLGQ